MKPKIRKVAVVGTMGTQIAIHSSFHGYEVTVYDPDAKSFEKSLRLAKIRMENSNRKPTLSLNQIQNEAKKIKFRKSLEDTVRDTDLVIEAIPEDVSLKHKIFKQIDSLAPKRAILATNSSSIPVSRIEKATGRPEKCLNLHFYSLDLGKNMVDIMGGSKTTSDTVEAGNEWVRSIGCVPLTVNKELLGFWQASREYNKRRA